MHKMYKYSLMRGADLPPDAENKACGHNGVRGNRIGNSMGIWDVFHQYRPLLTDFSKCIFMQNLCIKQEEWTQKLH